MSCRQHVSKQQLETLHWQHWSNEGAGYREPGFQDMAARVSGYGSQDFRIWQPGFQDMALETLPVKDTRTGNTGYSNRIHEVCMCNVHM